MISLVKNIGSSYYASQIKAKFNALQGTEKYHVVGRTTSMIFDDLKWSKNSFVNTKRSIIAKVVKNLAKEAKIEALPSLMQAIKQQDIPNENKEIRNKAKELSKDHPEFTLNEITHLIRTQQNPTAPSLASAIMTKVKAAFQKVKCIKPTRKEREEQAAKTLYQSTQPKIQASQAHNQERLHATFQTSAKALDMQPDTLYRATHEFIFGKQSLSIQAIKQEIGEMVLTTNETSKSKLIAILTYLNIGRSLSTLNATDKKTLENWFQNKPSDSIGEPVNQLLKILLNKDNHLKNANDAFSQLIIEKLKKISPPVATWVEMRSKQKLATTTQVSVPESVTQNELREKYVEAVQTSMQTILKSIFSDQTSKTTFDMLSKQGITSYNTYAYEFLDFEFPKITTLFEQLCKEHPISSQDDIDAKFNYLTAEICTQFEITDRDTEEKIRDLIKSIDTQSVELKNPVQNSDDENSLLGSMIVIENYNTESVVAEIKRLQQECKELYESEQISPERKQQQMIEFLNHKIKQDSFETIVITEQVFKEEWFQRALGITSGLNPDTGYMADGE